MKSIFITTILSLLSTPLLSQPSSRQEDVESNLHSIDKILSSKNILSTLYIEPDLSSIDVEDINLWAEDLKESKFSESGLELSGGYDYRFWNNEFIDDDYDDGETIPYKHRFLVTLKWNLMQSGLIDKESFRHRVDILSRTKSQEVANNTIKLLITESFDQQRESLYSYYNGLIDAKIALYDTLVELQEELVAKNVAKKLTLTDLNIERANVQRMRKRGVESASGVINLEIYISHQSLYVGDEYDSLINENNYIRQNRLDQELTLNEAKGISYWKELEVSPFIRVYNYLDESTNRKNAGKLGVTASLPIFTNTRSKRNEALSRCKLLTNEEQVIRKDISHQIAYLIQQLNENFETLNQLIESSRYYSDSCALAAEYYKDRTMTIEELSQRYINNLDNNIEIYKLIIEREDIKYSLYKVIYGF